MKKWMTFFLLFVFSFVSICAESSFAKDSLARNPRKVAKKSAIVIVLCEDGGRTAAGRLLEGFGRIAIDPFVRPYYKTRIWLVGAAATPDAFLNSLRNAAKHHEAVDVLLFAHGAPGYTVLAGKHLTPDALVKGLKGQGGEKIRMVYTTTCYSSHQFIKAWKDAGAWAFRGMDGVNRPMDFPRFFLGWTHGESYGRATHAGFLWNTQIHKVAGALQPYLKQGFRTAMDAIVRYPARNDVEKRIQKAAWSFAYFGYKWFRTSWDIRESTPHIQGGDARIDLLPGQKQKSK